MTAAFHATDRAVLRIAGPDAEHFLQGLVTNDLARLTDGPVYAAMLSPQGKYLFDFIMLRDGDDIELASRNRFFLLVMAHDPLFGVEKNFVSVHDVFLKGFR